MASELETAVERVGRWANYEWTTADQIAVESEISTFTAGDLRLILSANREMREALEKISEGGPSIGPVSKQTYMHGFDQGCAWAGGVARSALTTQRGDGE